MLVKNPKLFNLGILLSITFAGVLVLIFSPVFGGMNGLEYADNLFNKLSKGSSYFIPRVKESVQNFMGTNISLTIKLDKPQMTEQALKIMPVAGLQVSAKEGQLTFEGDLGKFMMVVLKDSDAMFWNDGKAVATAYGMDERVVMETWWNVLSRSVKELQKQRKIAEARVVTDVMQKGIEPAYNFFGVEAQSIGDKAFTVIGLLVFYVLYTMWWGYAIFYLFDGIGLSMKKAKVKKEV